MTNRMLSKLLCILIMLVATGCRFYWRSDGLTDSELSWINAAREHHHPYFASNLADTAELLYTDIWTYNSSPVIAEIHANHGLFETFYGSGGYDYVLQSPKRYIEGNFSIRAKYRLDDNAPGTSARLGSCYFKEIWPPAPCRPTEYTISQQVYDNCMVFDLGKNSTLKSFSSLSDEFVHPDSTNSISKFVISQEYGLIYFEFCDSEQYYRIFD